MRQLSTHEEYEYEDQDPIYDALDYDDEVTKQDWLGFQGCSTDLDQGEY